MVDANLSGEMFLIAQWALASEAAGSLAQMTARLAKGDSALARIARERQDLLQEWKIDDKELIVARSRLTDNRSVAAEAALSGHLAGTELRIVEIDKTLARDAWWTPLANGRRMLRCMSQVLWH